MDDTSPQVVRAAFLKHYGLRRGLENIITRLHINEQTSTYYGCKELDDYTLLQTLDTYIRQLKANQKEQK